MGNLDPQTRVMPFSEELLSVKNNSTAVVALAANATKLNTIADNAPGAALTADLTTLTAQAPAVADYAPTIVALSAQSDALSDSSAAIFGSVDEGKTLCTLVARLQTRLDEFETRAKAQGLLS
jgi:hypothetical protein